MTNAPNPPTSPKRPGYEYLTAYMLGKVIQDLTDQFCRNFLKSPKDPNYPNFKLVEQMNGAARSNSQNVAEGFTGESLKSYIHLTGIARGSNEELAKDFQDFLRQRGLPIWPVQHPKIREFRQFRVRWVSQSSLNTPTLPNNSTEAANMILTLCHLDGFLLKRLVDSLLEKHKTEGGLTEKLYATRIAYRRSSNS